jgi:hypothetical protein
MAVKIRAVRNNLGTGSLPWHAQASWSRLVDTEAFVNRMAAGRTTVTRTEILAVFQLAREELCALLAEGCYVKTPFGAALPVAKGSFKDMHEAFRPDSRESGHSLRFDFRLDPDLEDAALSRVECRRVSAEDRVSPVIRSVECMSGESGAGAIRVLDLRGARLGFDPADGACGLFLRAESRREWRVNAHIDIRPSRILALLPEGLPSGDYRVVVRARARGSAIRTAESQTLLSIQGCPKGVGPEP